MKVRDLIEKLKGIDLDKESDEDETDEEDFVCDNCDEKHFIFSNDGAKKEAEKSLIDDRLKIRAAEQLGVILKPGALNYEMEIFAKRANLTIDQFSNRLKKAGIDRITWENYMRVIINI